ncbi:DNA cross-link repair 1A protein-like isoform X2 [Macrobrachium nipponense]
MDSDEEDIFSYTPLIKTSLSQGALNKSKKTTRYTASQQAVPKNKLSRPNKKASLSSVKSSKVTPRKKKLSLKEKIDHATEVCPICQLPWFLLGQNGRRNIHIEKCGKVDFSKIPACANGVQCQENFERHYLLYSHEAWAKVRADPDKDDLDKLPDLDDLKSENDDSGFIDKAVPGPSGWKPKFKLIDITSDSSDVESLPELNQPFKKIKKELDLEPPDIDFYEEPQGARDMDEVTVKHSPRPSQTNSVDDKKTVVFPLDSPHIFNLSLNEHDDKSDGSSSSRETLMYEAEQNEHEAAGVAQSQVTKNTTCSSSDESQSLLQNKEQPPSPTVGTAVEDDSRIGEPEEQDFEDDFELLNKLVDEAVDKYVGKALANAKIEHLHIHYHTKGGQNSILNYFKPVSSNSSSEKTPSSSSQSTKMTSSRTQNSVNKKSSSTQNSVNKSSGDEWKTLMSKMQNNAKKAVNNLGTVVQNPPQKQVQQTQFYGGGGNRTCPFYKYITDTSFVVDAFSYGYLNGIDGYFLSHYHYDHFRGLTKNFSKPIYCSQITGNLVKLKIGVAMQYIKILPMDTPQVISNVEVTLLDANHCPGSVMFLFRLTTGTTILHVGDFRAHPKMESYPVFWECNIDTLYLDTTYCNPAYNFPSQDEIIEKCVNIATAHITKNPKSFIAVGSYTIGKERVFRAIACELDCRIWASSEKQRILRCIEDEEITSRLTSDKFSARVHVIRMNEIHPKTLSDYVVSMAPKYNEVIAIRPTGWEHSENNGVLSDVSPKKFGGVYIYGIPYSEHSSYNELQRFVKYIRPKKIIPTVNVGNPNTRKKMEESFSEWLEDV